ncbi:isocitrate dehydrogenase [NAD] subunit beta, mitochondrial [Bombina bombina]|uniref:isocitrate dehydrogenase [NAD] subunit beta, mitochondrial n=1 Tax=Bombina bombina TaxID=8345 RepID=UPI00235B29AA|nr:isocitrate dehydrogenase [NAD] subunit beta, mitochondrial [Bombina bombina]
MAALTRVFCVTQRCQASWGTVFWRSLSTSPRTQAEGVKPEGAFHVTMIPGDGVGPELMHSVKEVFKAAEVPVEFDEHHLSEVQNMASPEKLEEVLTSMRANKVAIKGDWRELPACVCIQWVLKRITTLENNQIVLLCSQK